MGDDRRLENHQETGTTSGNKLAQTRGMFKTCKSLLGRSFPGRTTTNSDREGFHVMVTRNAAEKRPQAHFQIRRNKFAAFFGAEYAMIVIADEGMSHRRTSEGSPGN